MITTTVQAGVRLLLGVLRVLLVLHGHLLEVGGHNHRLEEDRNHHNHHQVEDHSHRQEEDRSHHLVLIDHQHHGDYQDRNQSHMNQVQTKQDGAQCSDELNKVFHAS